LKVIIAGSRDITDYSLIYRTVFYVKEKFQWPITEIVSGGARGVDSLAERFAEEQDIPLKVFPADWNTNKKAAGPIRNRKMAEYADALIAIWDGESRGTKNMIDEATRRNLRVHIQYTGTNNVRHF
jgi:hypothetical protein